MTEYWLQKKTIGGWSMVTWYNDLEQAKANYAKCVGKDNLSGYSWRLCSIQVVEEAMLNDVVEVERVANTAHIDVKRGWGRPADILIQDAPKSNGWGDVPQSGWNSTAINPKPAVLNSWGDLPADSERPTHKGVGKVCMINHVLKERTKVDPSQVEEYIKAGYERGGPRTQFRE